MSLTALVKDLPNEIRLNGFSHPLIELFDQQSRGAGARIRTAPNLVVPLSGLIVTQPEILKRKLIPLAYLMDQGVTPNPPVIVNCEDMDFIWDGHHRIYLAKLTGLKQINVIYVEM